MSDQRDTAPLLRRFDSAEYDFCSGEIITPTPAPKKKARLSLGRKGQQGLTLKAWLRLERYGLLQ